MNPQQRISKPAISPIQYIAINKTPQAKRFVTQFGKTPATSMPDLQMKMATIVKQFGDEAKRELAKLHPDTSWIVKAIGTSKMEGGRDGEFISAHGKGCKCSKCSGLEKHMDFVTNYRSDADSPLNNTVGEFPIGADGERLAAKAKKSIMPVVFIISVLALGALIVASGERHRGYA